MRKIYSHFCDSSVIEFADEHFSSSEHPLVIVCSNNEHAERIGETIAIKHENAKPFIIPEVETLPYDEEFTQPSIVSARFQNIYRLLHSKSKWDVFLVPIRSLIEKNPDVDFYQAVACTHDLYDPTCGTSGMLDVLKANGYKETGSVEELGQFSVTENVIDVFGYGNEKPSRTFINEKKTFYFNTESQLNGDSIENYYIFSTHEFPYDEASLSRFRFQYRNLFKTRDTDVFKSVHNGQLPRGIDYYKPLFVKDMIMKPLLAVIPTTSAVLFCIDAEKSIQSIHNNFENRYKEIIESRPVLEPKYLLGNKKEIDTLLMSRPNKVMDIASKDELGIFVNSVRKQEKMHETFKKITAAHNETGKTLITINSQTRSKQLEMMFRMKGINFGIVDSWKEFESKEDGYWVLVADMDLGFINKRKGYTLITEFEIFDSKTMEEIVYDRSEKATHITELRVGDPLVHAKHGVGRFVGFKNYSDSNSSKEYVVLEYAESSSIFVSIDDLYLLSEYKGINPETTPLDNAASKHWERNLQSAIKDVKAVSKELLAIKAKRLAKKRPSFTIPTFEYRKFANEFRFIPTKDQSMAIQDILNDLEGDIAMDRLVVGDVGYGKTEVAMRAAMVVAHNKKQCCIIAPTTLLAEQHYHSFKERFDSFNFNIQLLTRGSKTEERECLKGLKNGSIDIVIGTHRLIQRDVEFANLGIFVIDEEHRFGVKQKEEFNKHRGSVDILSLTATPIPRTLTMTMHGIRDISTITTAPAKRLAVRTVAYDFDYRRIHEAIARELSRNGQIYYVHNDISTISEAASKIEEMFPEARVCYAHGKMKEAEMQSVMNAFHAYEYDILVATTIIEIGLDIPNANTIIITNCDKLGLAQMHQLRGRVGRSSKQAYCYLLRPENRRTSEIAEKRLQAMMSNTNLGGGFKISNADLEIRGAGEILGEDQSGHIQDIGFQMYFHLLEKAISLLEQGKSLSELDDENRETIVFYIPDSHNIPMNYIPNSGMRASIYKRLSECKSIEEFEPILSEMTDRYGEIPEPTRRLIELLSGRLEALKIGIRGTRISNEILTIAMDEEKNAEQLISKFSEEGIIPVPLTDVAITVPFKHFNRDGVIDYPRIASLYH